MTISAEHRSKFASLQWQWWRLQMSEKLSSEKLQTKQTGFFTRNHGFYVFNCDSNVLGTIEDSFSVNCFEVLCETRPLLWDGKNLHIIILMQKFGLWRKGDVKVWAPLRWIIPVNTIRRIRRWETDCGIARFIRLFCACTAQIWRCLEFEFCLKMWNSTFLLQSPFGEPWFEQFSIPFIWYVLC